MLFSKYAIGLFPYCSKAKSKADYFVELIGAFITEGSSSACRILDYKKDTLRQYITQSNPISCEDAQYIYDHRDPEKFIDWLSNRFYNNEANEEVSIWLDENGVKHDPGTESEVCEELLEKILLDMIKEAKLKTPRSAASDTLVDSRLLEAIERKIDELPKPKDIPVPKHVENKPYINELYRAYGDAENMSSFNVDDLSTHSQYEEDFKCRRIDYYAAVTIQRGIQELGSGKLSNQFDVLKNETLEGVEDTARRGFANGYDRMLAVMEQAVKVPTTGYLLGSSPNWISPRIKKGVCHHLVNDGKLKWVR